MNNLYFLLLNILSEFDEQTFLLFTDPKMLKKSNFKFANSKSKVENLA